MLVNFSRDEIIEFLRENGFNPFPIPKRPIGEEQKGADYRYKAENTALNQKILASDNWGVIARNGYGTCFADIDNKERYREGIQKLIDAGYFVVESPHGWHLGVTNLSGDIKKKELFDYDYQEKKIIEIQGFEHYVVGAESEIFDKETGQKVRYELRGGLKLWDAKGVDFKDFVIELCQRFNVEEKRLKSSSSSNQKLRERFRDGKVPTKGTSNDYFHQASKVCLDEGLTKEEAYERIELIYKKWQTHKDYSGRPWSNVSYKIDEVYANPEKFRIKGGRPKGNSSGINRTEIANELLKTRKFYSNKETHEIFEDRNGFLKKVNDILKSELYENDNTIEKSDYESILFKLESGAKDIPKTNKDLVSFPNGKFSRSAGTLIETDDLASMGFENYNYIENAEPTKFKEIIFEGVSDDEIPRLKASLKSALTPLLDAKMSVMHGFPRIGKTVRFLIIAKCLGQYALAVDLESFLEDHFIRANIRGKTLLVINDLPKDWKDFQQIITLLGENQRTERGFHEKPVSFENMITILSTTNFIAKFPTAYKAQMYSRLSLIKNTRTEQFKEDNTLIDRIVEEEGEQIISWILNLKDSECEYEDNKTVKENWEDLADPEINFVKNNYEFVLEQDKDVPLFKIREEFEEQQSTEIDIDQLEKSIRKMGYPVKNKIVSNIQKKGESF